MREIHINITESSQILEERKSRGVFYSSFNFHILYCIFTLCSSFILLLFFFFIYSFCSIEDCEVMASSVKCFGEGVSSSSCPCLCVDSMPSSIKGNAVVVSYFYRNVGKRRQLKQQRMVHLSSSSFLDSWSAKMLLMSCCSTSTKRHHHNKPQRLIVDELGGQYEDTFNDVKKELVDYFTFKAVRTVLEQLYEMNPPMYKWFNNFVADNVPNNGTRFLQTLVKERRELAERVMITRLTLYGRWMKKCDHGEIYKEISDENLKLMRERLLETIQWPSDDNTISDQETD